MSLKIYHCSRIEDLAEKLVGELTAERAAKGPFEFLKVAVANPNLGNWLKMKVLAKVPGLSAGVEMPFLDQQLADLLKAEYEGELELISGRDYPAIVLDALMNHWRKEFVPFRKYIKEEFDPSSEQKKAAEGVQNEANPDEVPLKLVSQREARKAVQLADKLAQLVDAYEATGNLGTLEKNKDENAVYGGEQALAETLFGSEKEKGLLPKNGKISLRQMFDVVKARKPQGKASRVVLFGHTSLTDLQIKILVWLSQTHEVIWYCPANILCSDSKFDSKSADGVAAYNLDVDKTIKKLCLSLKETFGNAIYQDERVFNQPKCDSVLIRLQSNQSRVGTYAAAVKKPQQDASVQIVGTPGIRREVEMVYNAILGAVWEKNEDGKPQAKKGMSFSDIAVIVPDVPTYRPMIEAVFDGRGQIPYGLVDATTQDYSTYLDGFLALMSIARYGLSRKRIFAALENPCVQRAMGFTRDEVVKWRELAEDFGAYEGYQTADSDEGNVSGHFNWEWALRRMRLGLVALNKKDKEDSWHIGVTKGSEDELPLEARDVDAVYKFSEVVETLYRKLDELNKMTPTVCSSADANVWPDTWAGRLHAVMDGFLAVEKDDNLESLVRARIIRMLNGLTAIEGEQSYKLSVAMVEHFVAGTECAKGGYLRHGVTIGGLRSLANVPFKQIFILGLGEGEFPGRNDCSTLDVRNTMKPEDRDDVLLPEENRARFRAAVMSARDRLVLSYPNRELGSDAKLYPSSPVSDVKGMLREIIGNDFKEFEGYPLSEFSEEIATPEGTILSAVRGKNVDEYFSGILPTYSKRAYVQAGFKEPKSAKECEAPATDGSGAVEAEKQELGEPTPRDLAEFVKDPFTAILKRRLGIATEGYRDHTLDDASPLGVQKGPPLWGLEKKIVLKQFDPVFLNSQKEANVPSGFIGNFTRNRFSKIVSFWSEQSGMTDEDRNILASGKSTDGLAVVCKSFDLGTDEDPIRLPPDAVLVSLFERLKKWKDEGFKDSFEFRVKVLNVPKKKIGCWKWSLGKESGWAGYYDSVKAMYLQFLQDKDDAGCYPAVTYDSLRKSFRTLMGIPSDKKEQPWDLLSKSLPEDRHTFGDKKAFNGNPVIDQVVDSFKRTPTGKELIKFFNALYRLPMSVEEEVTNETVDNNGGAQ